MPVWIEMGMVILYFLDAVARSLGDENIDVKTVVQGSSPVQTITAEAGGEGNYDLIMVTNKGRSGFDLTIIGSVAERIVEQSGRSIFIVPVLNGASLRNWLSRLVAKRIIGLFRGACVCYLTSHAASTDLQPFEPRTLSLERSWHESFFLSMPILQF